MLYYCCKYKKKKKFPLVHSIMPLPGACGSFVWMWTLVHTVDWCSYRTPRIDSPHKMIYNINELAEFLKILVSSACDIHITVYVEGWISTILEKYDLWIVEDAVAVSTVKTVHSTPFKLLDNLIFNLTFSTKMHYNTILCKLMNTVPECQTSVWWCAPHLTVICQCNVSGRVRSLAMEHNRVRLQARNTAWW